MKKIRIGNDIVIKWRITINGEEVNLEGLDLSLYISTTYQPRKQIAFTVAGNEITATYKGAEQKVTGVYRLTLYRNEGENSQSILDACDAFELVSCSCLTVDAAFGGAEVELPIADLGVGIPGLSAFEIAVIEGFKGTQAEWLASLSAASEAAAAECREFTDAAKIDERERQNNEALRVTAEDERAANERTRALEEQKRVTAESLRASAEVSRKTAEEAREADEQQRSTAEVGRSSAEELRKSNEQSRISEETTRSNNEAARISAETKRANAELTRKNNEDARQEAERGRVTAETARQSAEDDRLTNERNRTTAESQRVANETGRSNAESSRAAAETARQTAETSRQEAEQGRATAEQQRADAEAARAEEFATFEGKIAAKEDAANKVTSIGADANNTTFPTTRAVLNSIAEVKNIEVTPEMLSESTKQYINASGGGTITNLADDEDLTSIDNVLKLADKDYSPTSYSGMGRVYLRKNMADGKNILTQEMMTKENTIYIIQYDYDLNGQTINVPANCTLDFQGGSLANGTVNLNNTVLKGTPRIYTNFGGVIANDTIHTKWFMNLPNDADCSGTLRRIIKLAYTSSVNSSGWRMCKAIHIDAGIYTVKNSLIDSSLGVTAGQFNITGDGYVNTTINYDNSDVALFDNQQIFGFSKFEGISFAANNNATFANLVGGGSGNSQSFVFENCSFQKWTTILNSSGDTMSSEITFANCKIKACGNSENRCILFILNNPQAVNWRFIATDIESCFGTYFEAIRGFNVSIYQGSMIPYSADKDNPSIFLHIPADANRNSFGGGNSPQLVVNQSRFELRSYTHLIKQDADIVCECVFNNVGLGGYNLATDEDFYTLYLIGRSVIKFNNCENFLNFKLYHIGSNSQDTSALIYANTSLFKQLLANSAEYNYGGSNAWGVSYFHDIDTGEVSTSRSKTNPKAFCYGHNATEVSTTYSISAEPNTIAIYTGHSKTIDIVKPMILTGVTISHIGSPAYGGIIISYKVTTLDVDGNDVDTIMMTSNDMRASRKMRAFIRKATTVYGIRVAISDNFSGTAAVVLRGLISYTHY